MMPGRQPPPRTRGTPRALRDWRSLQLICTAEWMVELLERELEPIGLTWRRCKILAMIGKLQPVEQAGVAMRLGIDRSTMSAEVAVFREQMLVMGMPRRPGARRPALQLTDLGEQVLADAGSTNTSRRSRLSRRSSSRRA
jgi:DNA-binding MarR family transcriptional regulator